MNKDTSSLLAGFLGLGLVLGLGLACSAEEGKVPDASGAQATPPAAATPSPSPDESPSYDQAFQRDADVYRLRHLKHYGELIEAYRTKTGTFPLQGHSKLRLEVFVSNPDQREQMLKWTARGDPNNPSDRLPFSALVAELEKGLGKEIPEYYDPQLVATARPNFYIYLVVEDAYFFAVHVSQPYAFAQRVGDNNYKVEISSVQQGQARRAATLFSSPEFQAAIDAPVGKAAFFEQRAQAYLHASKAPASK